VGVIALRWAVFAALQAAWLVLAPLVLSIAVARWAVRPAPRRIPWALVN
jgi:hypothetical protein